MTFNDMQEYLNQIQKDRFQTRIMNAVLTCYQEIKTLEQAIIQTQQKVNEIIRSLNNQTENAEALNPEITEDAEQADIIVEDTDSASSSTPEG